MVVRKKESTTPTVDSRLRGNDGVDYVGGDDIPAGVSGKSSFPRRRESTAPSPTPRAPLAKRKGEKKAPLGGEAVPRSLSTPPSAVSNGEIVIYTDGACSGNPGPGGWAAVLIWNEHRKEISGYEAHTTNNRMELRAAIEALKTLKRKNVPVRIITDSQYLMHAFTKNWLESWVRKGWVTSSKEPVKNRELWEELLRITAHLKVQWAWTRGHALNELNNRCDELARAEIEKRRKSG